MSLESNIQNLPDFMSEYVKKVHEKSLLLTSKKKLDKDIKELEIKIKEWKEKTGENVMEIIPSEEEKTLFGEYGAIEVKSRNVYEKCNKNNMKKWNSKFYTMLFGDQMSPDDIESFSQGQIEWIWQSRECDSVEYIDRSFANKKRTRSTTPKKREKTKKRTKMTESKNIPRSKEDFMNLKCFEEFNKEFENKAN